MDVLKPKRVQLKRTKGWRKPSNTIVVSRPSKWGNPFHLSEFYLSLSMLLYKRALRGFWSPSDIPENLINRAYECHGEFLYRFNGEFPLDVAKRELAKKDLACWCPLNQMCHADILLELANKEKG